MKSLNRRLFNKDSLIKTLYKTIYQSIYKTNYKRLSIRLFVAEIYKLDVSINIYGINIFISPYNVYCVFGMLESKYRSLYLNKVLLLWKTTLF